MPTDSIDAVAHAKELNERRMRAWGEGKELLDFVHGEKRQFNAEEQAKWDRINAEIDGLDAERNVYLTAERRQQEAEEIREATLRDFGEPRVQRAERNEIEQFRSWVRGENEGTKDWEGKRGFEIPIQKAIHERQYLRMGMDASEARALAWDTGSVASSVPITVARSLYQYLELSISMFRAPTNKFTTDSGETMYFPKLAAHAIATQVSGQGTTLAGTDPTFARMQMDAFKYGELVRVANEVITDSGINIVDFLFSDVGRALGRKIDTDLVAGSGSGQPNGIMTAASAGTTTGGSLITPTYESLIDLEYSVVDEYRNSGSAGFLMYDTTAGKLRKLRDGNGGTLGQVMWLPSPTMGLIGGQPDLLTGFPVYTDANVASMASNAKIMGFGDFSRYYIRQIGNVVLERDDSRYFDTDEVGIRGKWRIDGDLIDTGAFKALVQNV